ncbi:hypothetical protein [Kribbella sp. NPDC000426]|uniref:hypothetical protein n=1 Tax=Kribbella sp. NPDC000426 TaxID=3154255 RepID=UPI00332690CE
MAEPVVVAGGTVGCGHAGTISVATVSTGLTVGSKGVLLLGQEAGLAFLPAAPPTAPVPPQCAHVTTSQVPLPAPCITQAASSGTATKLTVGHVPVLLSSAQGTTTTPVPNAVPPINSTWSVSNAGQTRLTAL